MQRKKTVELPNCGPVPEGKRKRVKMKAGPRQLTGNVNRRPNPIVIRPVREATYADIAKKLKEGIDVEALEARITTMQQTKVGDIVLWLDRDPKQHEAIE